MSEDITRVRSGSRLLKEKFNISNFGSGADISSVGSKFDPNSPTEEDRNYARMQAKFANLCSKFQNPWHNYQKSGQFNQIWAEILGDSQSTVDPSNLERMLVFGIFAKIGDPNPAFGFAAFCKLLSTSILGSLYHDGEEFIDLFDGGTDNEIGNTIGDEILFLKNIEATKSNALSFLDDFIKDVQEVFTTLISDSEKKFNNGDTGVVIMPDTELYCKLATILRQFEEVFYNENLFWMRFLSHVGNKAAKYQGTLSHLENNVQRKPESQDWL